MYEKFFMQHLLDQVQAEYDLDDEEMSKLISYLEKFEADPRKALKMARKKQNKKNLDNIVRMVLNKEIADNSHTEYRPEPVLNGNKPFVFPIGLPLSKDMIIEPHTGYED